MTRASTILLRLCLLIPALASVQAETTAQSPSQIIAIQQAQIEMLRRSVDDLETALAAVVKAVDGAKVIAEAAQRDAGSARSAAETADKKAMEAAEAAGAADRKASTAGEAAANAQRSANASVKCGGTVSIRTTNPKVPSHLGWLRLTDTVVASGEQPGGGWGFNLIYCN